MLSFISELRYDPAMAWTQLEDFRDRPAAEAVPLSKHQDFVVKDKRKKQVLPEPHGCTGRR